MLEARGATIALGQLLGRTSECSASKNPAPTPALGAASARPQGPVIGVDRFRSLVRPDIADSRSSSSSTERPLIHTQLPSRCEGQVSAVELPVGASVPTGVNDPLLPFELPDGRHSIAAQRTLP